MVVLIGGMISVRIGVVIIFVLVNLFLDKFVMFMVKNVVIRKVGLCSSFI